MVVVGGGCGRGSLAGVGGDFEAAFLRERISLRLRKQGKDRQR